jgi:NADH-quinone oxidoreductase E subunit
MKIKEKRSAIEKIVKRYPQKESAILPALYFVQGQNNNMLSGQDVKDVAQIIGVSESKIFGVATYYTMFNKKPVGTYHLQVDTNIPAMLMGAEEIVACLEKMLDITVGETTPDGMFTLSTVEDLGSGGTCPVVQVNDTYYERMTTEKVDALIASLKNGEMPPKDVNYNYGTECGILFKNRDKVDSASIKTYKNNGGYAALKKAREMKPEAVLAEVKDAEIRGRGGAGFPAGLKWSLLSKDDDLPIYLICNADEGEPGTFKDREVMEYDPHLLIEGISITAYAIGSKKAFIYIRGEFVWIANILETAIEEAVADNQLADLDIVVHRGAGSYVCGEETALIESLEGKRGNPRLKPPFPANVGLYGCPTIVNNVETLACVPFIIENGAAEFKKIGAENNYGPKLFSVSGHVNKPGVYEYPMGTPLKDILAAAGGVNGNLKAVIVGGLSNPVMKAEEIEDLKLDFDSCMNAGTMLGPAGIIVMNDTVSIPKIALRSAKFYAHESCGQCVPCREGTYSMVNFLDKLVSGNGTKEDLEALFHLSKSIHGLTLCPGGDAAVMPIEAMLNKFREEFEALAN